MKIGFAAVFALLASLIPALAPAQEVVTVAGSGLSGFADGAATAAEFVMPVGLAFDAGGNLFIADAGSQRIRELAVDGSVRTVAGSGPLIASQLWVEGGYLDGPVRTARFNHPSAVVAGPNGVLYVADTLNHCIRSIANGQVTTYAGYQPIGAPLDGIGTRAFFMYPRALALAPDGTLYVIDYSGGLRAIAPDRRVTTIPLPKDFDNHLGSIALAAAGVIYVSNATGVLALDRNYHELWRRTIAVPRDVVFDFSGELDAEASQDAASALGAAFGIAVTGDSLLYTDPRTNAIRSLGFDGALASARLLNRPPGIDATFRSGGFRDGALNEAEFDGPLGIAVQPVSGAAFIADTGNRRIRRITFPSGTSDGIGLAAPIPVQSVPALDPHPGNELYLDYGKLPSVSSKFYRIAYLGNSFSYWNTRWDESIAGVLQKRLNEDRPALGARKPFRVIAINPLRNLRSIREYTKQVLAQGVVDAVALQLNIGHVLYSYPSGDPDFVIDRVYVKRGNGTGLVKDRPSDYAAYAKIWRPQLTGDLRAIEADLKKAGIPFFVVMQPYSGEIAPIENLYGSQMSDNYPAFGYLYWSHNSVSQPLHQAVDASRVAALDLYPAFFQAERSSVRVPLFGTSDFHLSVRGRAFIANAVAAFLEQRRPWNRAPSR